jgi:hypothetical protein
MRDYLNIGSSPPDEDCAQMGSPGYHEKAREECTRYIELLRQVCGKEPRGARLAVKGFQHDAGPMGMDIDTYHEVVCHYDDDIPVSVDYAYHLESHGPQSWDGRGGEKWVFVPAPAPEAHETGEECHCPSCEAERSANKGGGLGEDTVSDAITLVNDDTPNPDEVV